MGNCKHMKVRPAYIDRCHSSDKTLPPVLSQQEWPSAGPQVPWLCVGHTEDLFPTLEPKFPMAFLQVFKDAIYTWHHRTLLKKRKNLKPEIDLVRGGQEVTSGLEWVPW